MVRYELGLFAFIAVATVYQTALGSPFGMEINPEKTIAYTGQEVTITCNPGDDKANDLQAIEIFKDKEKNPLVSINQESEIQYASDKIRKKYQADGRMSPGDLSKRYLRLTLLNPTSRDSGQFRCELVNNGSLGNVRVVSTNQALTVQTKLDSEGLETVLYDMLDKMFTLEQENKKLWEGINQLVDKDSVILDKVFTLEDESFEHSESIQNLKSTGTDSSSRLRQLEKDSAEQSQQISDLERVSANHSEAITDLDAGLTNQSDWMTDSDIKGLILSQKVSDLEMSDRGQAKKLEMVEKSINVQKHQIKNGEESDSQNREKIAKMEARILKNSHGIVDIQNITDDHAQQFVDHTSDKIKQSQDMEHLKVQNNIISMKIRNMEDENYIRYIQIKALQNGTEQLSSNMKQVQDVNEKLSSSGDASANSIAKLSSDMKELVLEVNVKQLSRIEELEKKDEKLSSDVTVLLGVSEKQSSDINALGDSDKELSSDMTTVHATDVEQSSAIKAIESRNDIQSSHILLIEDNLQKQSSHIKEFESSHGKIQSGLKALEATIDSKIDTLRQNIQQGSVKANGVAFSAGLTHDQELNYLQRVTYDRVFINLGGGYDPKTGIFTCPRAGTYLFQFYGLSGRISMYIQLVHNDKHIVSVFAHRPRNHEGAGNSVTLQLAKDDRIFIIAVRKSVVHGRSQRIFTTFSGHLLSGV